MNGNLPVSGRKRNRLCNDNVFGFQFKNVEPGLGRTVLVRAENGVYLGGRKQVSGWAGIDTFAG